MFRRDRSARQRILRRAGKTPKRPGRSNLEPLEPRLLLAAYSLLPDVVDGEVGSLREAILRANTNGEDDVIELAPGTYRLTLRGANEANAASGDLDLTDSQHQIVIRGADAATTIIDATALNDCAFDVMARVYVVFEGITIQGGSGVDAGGAINAWTSSPPYSPAPKFAGSLTVRDCVLRDNRSTYEGGAINNWGPLLIENSSFLDNFATYEGGGLEHNGGGHARIVRSSFVGNHANYEGGGVSVGTRTVGTTSMTIEDSTLAQTVPTTSAAAWISNKPLSASSTRRFPGISPTMKVARSTICMVS